MSDFCRPAEAYYAVFAILPADYHTTAPPVSGVRLKVTGQDGMTTTWDMTEGLAKIVTDRLNRRKVHVEAKAYDNSDWSAR